MLFTVNEFQDLLEILRAQPAWKEALRRELFGEELLMLPALVRDLVRAVQAMNQRLGLVEQRLENVEQRAVGIALGADAADESPVLLSA